MSQRTQKTSSTLGTILGSKRSFGQIPTSKPYGNKRMWGNCVMNLLWMMLDIVQHEKSNRKGRVVGTDRWIIGKRWWKLLKSKTIRFTRSAFRIFLWLVETEASTNRDTYDPIICITSAQLQFQSQTIKQKRGYPLLTINFSLEYRLQIADLVAEGAVEMTHANSCLRSDIQGAALMQTV